ncbi:hypothetical protein IFM89_022355 [Coptis chinensis]|uniref:Post-SET domain-containing protein n=1 Tax=Coptis chinensis TaxID=261450 RepID=A0A835LCC5_9MAGN|nr:hypothetical protein IFM89_022355 [Coptis chinensis]
MAGANLALQNNVCKFQPMRVIRGHKVNCTEILYTYDGLYDVLKCWPEKEESGFIVYKYKLKRKEGSVCSSKSRSTFGGTKREGTLMRTSDVDEVAGNVFIFELIVFKQSRDLVGERADSGTVGGVASVISPDGKVKTMQCFCGAKGCRKRFEAVTRKTRLLDVAYNASNNELVRTQTLVKSAISQVDATPFRQWYL